MSDPAKQSEPEGSFNEKLDPKALSAIRALMQNETDSPQADPHPPRPARPSAAARVAQHQQATTPQDPPKPARKLKPFKLARVKQKPAKENHGKQGAKGAGSTLGWIKAFRPARKYLVIAALVLLLAWRPWLMLGLSMLTVMFVVGVFLSIGPDSVWQWVMARLKNLSVTRPATAQRILKRLDRVAGIWDRCLDVLPEGMADDLYMPDFNALIEADARHGDALDRRLDALGQG